jgi:hypothetical protein
VSNTAPARPPFSGKTRNRPAGTSLSFPTDSPSTFCQTVCGTQSLAPRFPTKRQTLPFSTGPFPAFNPFSLSRFNRIWQWHFFFPFLGVHPESIARRPPLNLSAGKSHNRPEVFLFWERQRGSRGCLCGAPLIHREIARMTCRYRPEKNDTRFPCFWKRGMCRREGPFTGTPFRHNLSTGPAGFIRHPQKS